MPKRISAKHQPLYSRVYTREEMETITGIPQSNKNFKRAVEKWLETYGYTYELTQQRGGDFHIISRKETAEQRLHTIMIDELGLDRQTQPAEFAYYIYFLMTYPNAEWMPFVEQLERINALYGRDFGISTIQTWQRRLQAAGAVDVHTSKNYWKTIREERGKRRIYIEDRKADPDYARYWARLNEILSENEAQTGFRCWDKSFGQIWNEMGMIIYSCPARLINIIGNHAEEICNLAREVVEADMARLNMEFPSNVDGTTGDV